MNLTPFASTFVIITLAELGDKTQLATITLATRENSKVVFLASMVAFVLIGGVSILLGSTLASILPLFWIKIGSGSVFTIVGLYNFFAKEKENVKSCGRVTFIKSFSLVALMELGDKTQLATIALAARYLSPFLVFSGMFTAFLLITGISVFIGSRIKGIIPTNYIKIGTSFLFMAFGIILLLNTLMGVKLL